MTDEGLVALARRIADGSCDAALLTPETARAKVRVGATRQDPERFHMPSIGIYLYAGDTALHVAAAAHDLVVARVLVAHGADVRARNRRGAEPLHYAASAPAGVSHGDVIRYLVEAGADPDAADKSGVAPLHRAVRTRRSAAVAALLDCGADPELPNASGSTPLFLALRTTGRGGAGTEAAKAEQRRIVAMLIGHGAGPGDDERDAALVRQVLGDGTPDPRR